MPPRWAYSPVSRTVEERRKPLVSSQRTRSFILTELPGAAEKLSLAIHLRGATRCTRPLTVTQRMRGLSVEERARARRDSTVMRREATAPLGETRS